MAHTAFGRFFIGEMDDLIKVLLDIASELHLIRKLLERKK